MGPSELSALASPFNFNVTSVIRVAASRIASHQKPCCNAAAAFCELLLHRPLSVTWQEVKEEKIQSQL